MDRLLCSLVAGDSAQREFSGGWEVFVVVRLRVRFWSLDQRREAMRFIPLQQTSRLQVCLGCDHMTSQFRSPSKLPVATTTGYWSVPFGLKMPGQPRSSERGAAFRSGHLHDKPASRQENGILQSSSSKPNSKVREAKKP